ncbi:MULTISPECIES: transketolase [unclassified Romboutsia]|uniref:transketolase n=1 Tax=unclassified Romboutsia TaxID=2626894 RepID=UPI000821B0BD|nr:MULTISPECIES: transketolase [unclassified Romboutsia]SCH83670.1 Transketolase [uncultured Clostridium sp.]
MYKQLENHAINIRQNIVEMITESKSGHPGGSLSSVEILTYLYFKEMNINENNLNMKEKDYFVLSKGHAAPVLYATLSERGFIPKEELMTLRKIGSRLQGHPDSKKIDEIDVSTGSLGQGISNAVGLALGIKIDDGNSRVYTLLGDGELQEGIVWEAVMSASHYKLDNLVAIIDYNTLQIDGKNEDVMNIKPLDKKFESFGWNVIVIDGHDFNQIEQAFDMAKKIHDRPSVIVARTTKGKGVSFMENSIGWHGSAPNTEQRDIAINELEDVRKECL